jgi:hypothetical protein
MTPHQLPSNIHQYLEDLRTDSPSVISGDLVHRNPDLFRAERRVYSFDAFLNFLFSSQCQERLHYTFRYCL